MKPFKTFGLAAATVLAMAVAGCGDDDPMGPENGPDDPMSPLAGVTLTAQVDRFGLPAINTVFIPSADKDTYNQSVPAGDVAAFGASVQGFLDAVEPLAPNRPFDSATLTSVLLPDVQPLLLPGFGPALNGFPSGRKLADDVIDTELFLIFGENAALNSDGVDQNDVPFLNTFPFLATPHTP